MKRSGARRCRVCGCDDVHACPEGCWWVEPDLCSNCASVAAGSVINRGPSISFTVPGEPVGFLHITQGQLKMMKIPDRRIRSLATLNMKNRIRKYLAYKDTVRTVSLNLLFDRKPKNKVYLDVMVWFASHRHPDPENVRKGVQDSVFDQDKMVAGAVDFDYDAKNPRVEICIGSDPHGGELIEKILRAKAYLEENDAIG